MARWHELLFAGEPKPVGRGAECESGEDAWLTGTIVLPPPFALLLSGKVKDLISELNKHVREMPGTAAVTHPSHFAVRPL